MAKGFPFGLPTTTVPEGDGSGDFDSYASFQEDIWNEAGPGAWWDWWTETRDVDQVAAANQGIDQLVPLGCERVDLLGEMRNLASEGLAYGITAQQLQRHLQTIEEAVEQVTSILGTGLALDPEVREAAPDLVRAADRWTAACTAHAGKLHRTRHVFRDQAIKKFQRYVTLATGRSRNSIIAPIVSLCIGTKVTEAQLRMLRQRSIERGRR